jgi:sugar phosphate permease
MFAVTFCAMVTRHACLSAWSISKTNVHEQEGFSKPELGYFDTSFLLFYAIGNFIAGVLGDNYPLRYVTSAGMLIATGAYLAVSPTQLVLLGYEGTSSFPAFIVFWAICGFCQSAVWPGGVAVISNWFPKQTRGRVMGFWSSNSSVGEVLGQQIGGLMLGVIGLSWEAVMLVTSLLMGGTALLFVVVVRDKPSKDLQEDYDQEYSYRDILTGPPNYAVADSIHTKRGISFWKAWLLPG